MIWFIYRNLSKLLFFTLFLWSLFSYSIASSYDTQLIQITDQLFGTHYPIKSEQTVHNHQGCAYENYNQLVNALSNSSVSAKTKEYIQKAIFTARPEFTQTYQYGNFVFYFTDNDTDTSHNISLSAIQNLAIQMQNSRDLLYQRFNKYASDSQGNIEVLVYDILGASGFTNSSNNKIHLNSTDMQNACYMKTTSAHEIFHRFQFAYGLDQGGYEPNQSWWVEATADWSMKYCHPDQFDYIYDANDGFDNPNLQLFKSRSYDAVHFWIYLGERFREAYGQDQDESWIIKELLSSYELGFRQKKLITHVSKPYFSQTSWAFLQDWHITNFTKDSDTSDEKYQYDDQDNQTNNCGTIYSMNSVPYDNAVNVTHNQFNWISNEFNVSKGGAVYHVFNILSGVTQIEFSIEPTSDSKFYYTLIGLKNNIPILMESSTQKDFYYQENFNDGTYDQLVLVISSRKKTGTYQIKINS